MTKQPDSRTIKITDLFFLSGLTFVCGLMLGIPVVGWGLWPMMHSAPPPVATYTPYPTYTPWPTLIATDTPTSFSTPAPASTSVPEAIMLSQAANLIEGPMQNSLFVGSVDPSNGLVVIGQYNNCSWLKVTTSAQLTGWLPNDGSTISLQTPCETIPAGTFRPQTGFIKLFPSTGSGQLTADNGLPNDAVLIFSNAAVPAESLAAAYIRSGEKYTFSGIPDGDYIIFIAMGSEWNGTVFTVDQRARRFEDAFNFATSTYQYTTWDITLHPVVGGTAHQEELQPDELPTVQ